MSSADIEIRLSDIIPQIYRADFYPFNPKERIGLRQSVVSSFIYLIEGKGSITIGSTVYACKQENLLYIPPGVPHLFHADPLQPMVHASIYFDWISSKPRTGDMSLFHYGPSSPPAANCSPAIRFQDIPAIPAKLHVPKHTRAMEMYLGLIESIEQTQEEAKLYRRAAFEQFIAEMASLWRNPTLKNDRRIRTVMYQMREFPQNNVSLDHWAAQLGISASYLHKLFIREIGMSPHAYALQCKLERAKKMLRETNLSVTAITDHLGFTSIHYFSRLFTNNFGESPTAYRKRLRDRYSCADRLTCHLEYSFVQKGYISSKTASLPSDTLKAASILSEKM